LEPPTSATAPSEVWSPPDRPDPWGTGRPPTLTSPIVVQPDVGRLTDQVIRAIDDRLIAWRERMGR
jgi:hypothetical protein